jgi:hypothetical protein
MDAELLAQVLGSHGFSTAIHASPAIVRQRDV